MAKSLFLLRVPQVLLHVGFRLRGWYIVYKIVQVDWRLLRDCLKVYWRNSWGATVVGAWNGLKAGRGFRCRWLIVRRPQGKIDSCLKQITVSYCECFWGTQNPTSSGPDYQNGRSRTKLDVARRWILAPIAFVPVMRIENCDGIVKTRLEESQLFWDSFI